MNRNIGLAGRTLDRDLADRCILELLLDEHTNLMVRADIFGKQLGIGIPLGRPVLDDAEANPGWMYFLTHSLYSSPTLTVM